MGNEQGKEKMKISIICGKVNFAFNPIMEAPSNTDYMSSTAVPGRGNRGTRTEGVKKMRERQDRERTVLPCCLSTVNSHRC